jgi:hypothetical protein
MRRSMVLTGSFEELVQRLGVLTFAPRDRRQTLFEAPVPSIL